MQFLDYSSLFYFLAVCEKLTPRGKTSYRKEELSDLNFLQKERTRQRKYYKPMNTLTKALLKERREAGKERVYDWRNRSRKTWTEATSNETVKLNSQTVGRLLVNVVAWINLKIKRLGNENALLKRKTERLHKRIQRSNKKFSLLLLTPKTEVDSQLRNQGISPSTVKGKLLCGEVLTK